MRRSAAALRRASLPWPLGIWRRCRKASGGPCVGPRWDLQWAAYTPASPSPSGRQGAEKDSAQKVDATQPNCRRVLA
jgi:hypothetical protein